MNVRELEAKLKGTIIPVTTPFTQAHVVDYDALKGLMSFYLEHGLRCFIAAGSTGQCYVLSEQEHKQIVRTIMDACSDYDGCFVLGACSHTSTAVSNRLADICQSEGVDALLMTAPYYRTHRDMCIMHYTDVAKKHDIPLIIYHDETMPEDIEMWDEIVKEPKILGVKFATGNIAFARQLIVRYRDRLAVFGGGSMLQFLPMCLHGATGYVSSFASFIPEIERDFQKFIDAEDYTNAAKIAELEYDLFERMGNRSWFSYLVGLINVCGLPGKHCRPPLPDVGEDEYPMLEEFLAEIKCKHKKIMDEITG